MYTVYGSPTCSRCTIIKNILNSEGIEYAEVSIQDLPTEDIDNLTRKCVSKGIEATLPIILNEKQELVTIEEVRQCK